MIYSRLTAVLGTTPLLLGLVSLQPAFAAEHKGEPAKQATVPAKKGENVDRDKRDSSPHSQAARVVLAILADQLAVEGDRNKDAMALITAARIQAQLGMRTGKDDKTTQGKLDPKARPAGPARDMTVNGLLERARQYAVGRKDLIALADEVARMVERGREGGPLVRMTEIQAGLHDFWAIKYGGGEPAAVAVSHDGDADLEVFVRDESGNTVCATRAGGGETCRWMPKWTGLFRIEVRNIGIVSTRYRIITN